MSSGNFVLVVDDSRSSLQHLCRIVESSGDVRTRCFEHPTSALEEARRTTFDLVIVDYEMPDLNGIELIQELRSIPAYLNLPIIMITGSTSDSVRIEALRAGATDFLPKDSNRIEVQVRVRNLLALSTAVKRVNDQAAWLATEVQTATRLLLKREEEMIFRLSLAVEYRDNDTGGHTLRVATYSQIIAEQLGIPADICRQIYLASPLHDVGKVAIPDSILLKPGRLDEDEFAIIRTHSEIGERILGGSTSDLIRLAAEIAGAHHERWDGTGYPNGLSGRMIPLAARIVAIADVFDALTTERPYKKAMPIDAAFDYIDRERSRHFDPVCVDAFLKAKPRVMAMAAAESKAAA